MPRRNELSVWEGRPLESLTQYERIFLTMMLAFECTLTTSGTQPSGDATLPMDDVEAHAAETPGMTADVQTQGGGARWPADVQPELSARRPNKPHVSLEMTEASALTVARVGWHFAQTRPYASDRKGRAQRAADEQAPYDAGPNPPPAHTPSPAVAGGWAPNKNNPAKPTVILAFPAAYIRDVILPLLAEENHWLDDHTWARVKRLAQVPGGLPDTKVREIDARRAAVKWAGERYRRAGHARSLIGWTPQFAVNRHSEAFEGMMMAALIAETHFRVPTGAGAKGSARVRLRLNLHHLPLLELLHQVFPHTNLAAPRRYSKPTDRSAKAAAERTRGVNRQRIPGATDSLEDKYVDLTFGRNDIRDYIVPLLHKHRAWLDPHILDRVLGMCHAWPNLATPDQVAAFESSLTTAAAQSRTIQYATPRNLRLQNRAPATTSNRERIAERVLDA